MVIVMILVNHPLFLFRQLILFDFEIGLKLCGFRSDFLTSNPPLFVSLTYQVISVVVD